MDLTTANGGDPSKLSDHYEELIRRIKRKTGVEDIQYWKMTTREGNGVSETSLHGRPHKKWRLFARDLYSVRLLLKRMNTSRDEAWIA
jgi:hypothetical protein